ncbi:hypothetical protein OUZ56_000856 [Daphnia magna]|uniref:Uncharacterized protein n=1 Tax=Daphnia magna TaxID=35525 RepID=A0ABR0A0Y5_9CRUS|nr:hypothetical protein OUZ56_000856 [Daphnia magna]
MSVKNFDELSQLERVSSGDEGTAQMDSKCGFNKNVDTFGEEKRWVAAVRVGIGAEERHLGDSAKSPYSQVNSWIDVVQPSVFESLDITPLKLIQRCER